MIEREPPIEPTAMLCSTIRKLYSSDEIRHGIAFDERFEKVQGIHFSCKDCHNESKSYFFSLEVIKETYFKDKPIEFEIFWQKQGRKTINGQKRAFCSRQKQKQYIPEVL